MPADWQLFENLIEHSNNFDDSIQRTIMKASKTEAGRAGASPHSTIWTRTMLGQPSASALANHALADIKFGAGFKANMGLAVLAENSLTQSDLEDVLHAQMPRVMSSTGELRFLCA